MLYVNLVKKSIEDTGFATGCFVQLESAEVAEIAAATGYDFVIIDMEHGSFCIDSLPNLIRGVQVAGSTPIVRLPDDSETNIQKALDAGASGILIPRVSNAEQAKRAVSAAYYAPKGRRGACPRIRATAHGINDWQRHVEWSNKNVMVWLLIEDVEGFENLDKIASIPHVHSVALGPWDLSQSMGLGGDVNHKDVKKKIVDAISIARDHQVETVITLFEELAEDIESAARNWIDLGCRIIVSGTDRRCLVNKFKHYYSAVAKLRD